MRAWIQGMFNSKIVKKEGVVRRKKSMIDERGAFEDMLESVKKRKYHLIETGDQYIIICNQGRIKMHC